jgi:hypothetical protein
VINRLWPDGDLDAGTNNLYQALHATGGFSATAGPACWTIRSCWSRWRCRRRSTVHVGCGEAGRNPESLAVALARCTGELSLEDVYEDWSTRTVSRRPISKPAWSCSSPPHWLNTGTTTRRSVLALEPVAVGRPHDEEVNRALLQVLFAGGRRRDPARAFGPVSKRSRGAWSRAVPGAVDMYRQLSTGGAADHSMVRNNLPAPASSFIGRGGEPRNLTTALDRPRPVTITSPGGAGKRRLPFVLARRRTLPRCAPMVSGW